MRRHVLEEQPALAPQLAHARAEGRHRLARRAAPAQPDIERARAAVMGRGLLEAEHDGAQVRQAQPVRHDAAQDAALLEEAVARGGGALAGDDEHDLVAALARAVQESR